MIGLSNTSNRLGVWEGRDKQKITRRFWACGKDRISFRGSRGVMNLYWNGANHRLFWGRIRKGTAGVSGSSPERFHLWRLPAHPVPPFFRPFPWFLNPPGRVGGEEAPDSFLSRPVLSLTPGFGFRVDWSFSLRFGRLDLKPKAGGRNSGINLLFGSAAITSVFAVCFPGK